MPKYIVEYGLDVPAYGEIEIEVDSENRDDVVAHIKKLHEEDALIGDWDPCPDVGCDNYRVVSVRHQPTSENIDDDYFSLEKPGRTPAWTTTPPTEPGHYWFFGNWVVGGCGGDFSPDFKPQSPEMLLVRIHEVSNGVIAVCEGHFMSLRQFSRDVYLEGHIGYWAKAELPEPPEDEKGFWK